mmetsp:Transcript_26725/g.70195  ORF Transcript_26725/g.70195 Transcript_26725/m.70195 type:complete len:107 (-) Transcript_26725:2079-2399(-)
MGRENKSEREERVEERRAAVPLLKLQKMSNCKYRNTRKRKSSTDVATKTPQKPSSPMKRFENFRILIITTNSRSSTTIMGTDPTIMAPCMSKSSLPLSAFHTDKKI